MVIYRKTRVPLLYTKLPFVRVDWPGLVDCPEDRAVLQKLKLVATGRECPSVLETLDLLIVKCDIPDYIVGLEELTNRMISYPRFHWKLHDAEWFVTKARPAEAVSLQEAGITPDALEAIGRIISCIPLLRQRQRASPTGRDGTPTYLLTEETAQKLGHLEEQAFATARLVRLKGIAAHAERSAQDAKRPGSISGRLRERVLRRDGYRCAFCRSKVRPIDVHHVIPRSLIAKLDLNEELNANEANLITSCRDCNEAKSDYLAREDIRLYMDLFADPGHPNHSILGYLRRVSDLQSLE